MKITWCVNTTGLTGGIKVVFEYANRLQARGHEVVIVYPYNLTAKNWPRKTGWIALAKRLKFALNGNVKWFDLKVPVYRVPRLTDRYLPDADVVIATANETADWVAKLSDSKGKKFYFIQHYEDWSRDATLVDATWKLPLNKIVIASWLKEKAQGFGENVAAIIPNGVNTKDFYPSPKPNREHPQIIMMVHTLEWKGTREGLAAINKLQKAGVRFELVLFGAYPEKDLIKIYGDLWPSDADYIYHPTGEALRKLYAEADIFISPSHSEGCQLPPMEAMACGTAVVATNVGGIPDYVIAGETALVVPPKDAEALQKAILDLIEHPTKRIEIAEAGYEYIQQYTWDKATDSLEKALLI